MATVRVYTVTGISPDGSPVESSIIAESAAQARQKAESSGMRRVVVGTYREVEEPRK